MGARMEALGVEAIRALNYGFTFGMRNTVKMVYCRSPRAGATVHGALTVGAPNDRTLYGDGQQMSLPTGTGLFRLAVDEMPYVGPICFGRRHLCKRINLWPWKKASSHGTKRLFRAAVSIIENMGQNHHGAPMPCAKKLGLTKQAPRMTKTAAIIGGGVIWRGWPRGCIVWMGRSRIFDLIPKPERKSVKSWRRADDPFRPYRGRVCRRGAG